MTLCCPTCGSIRVVKLNSVQYCCGNERCSDHGKLRRKSAFDPQLSFDDMTDRDIVSGGYKKKPVRYDE